MTVLQQHTNVLRELKEQPSSARPLIFAVSPIVSTPDQLQASSNLGGALASATGVNNKLLTSYSSVTSQNCKPTTTSSGSDRPPFSDGVRYRQMDRQEDN